MTQIRNPSLSDSKMKISRHIFFGRSIGEIWHSRPARLFQLMAWSTVPSLVAVWPVMVFQKTEGPIAVVLASYLIGALVTTAGWTITNLVFLAADVMRTYREMCDLSPHDS